MLVLVELFDVRAFVAPFYAVEAGVSSCLCSASIDTWASGIGFCGGFRSLGFGFLLPGALRLSGRGRIGNCSSGHYA